MPVEFLRGVVLGTRVVVRTTIPGGLTDALGYLRQVDRETCEVETKRGLVSLRLADVVAAKEVPPPPPRRGPRMPVR
jgi:hypothetical protein